MSIYISGIDMPTEGAETIIKIQPDGTVLDQYGHHLAATASSIAAHGDLIDRDALRKSFRKSVEACRKLAGEMRKAEDVEALILAELGIFVECSIRTKNAPTIIPADQKGEL